MDVDQAAGVMRCPYCRREVLMPQAQAAGAGWPFGAGGTGMPHITINARTLAPEVFRRQRLVMVVFVVVVFLLMGAVVFPLLLSSLFDSSGEVKEVGVGATTRVQSFEVTVRGADCTKQEITKPDDPATSYDDSATYKAEGKFCLVSFSVKNVGEKTDSYPTYSLEATSPTQRVLDRDVVAESYANPGSGGLNEPIDPGKTVDQLLVFAVPADTTIAYLQIANDLFADSIVKVKFGS
jgi:hypothetical protein